MTGQEYLERVLSDHKLDEGEVKRVQNIRKEIENKILDHYGSKIEKVIYSGSYAKDTAINLKYDVDLCVYFKKSSFTALSSMYDDVFSFLSKSFSYPIRKQNVSIRLSLPDSRSIDIVPARSFEDGTNDANLYSLKTGSSIKTNIKKHVDYISKSKARPIIKLTKIWKIENDIHFKSFALELIVIKALSSSASGDYGNQFWDVLKYIKNYATSVVLIDPANSNNNVADLIDYLDKTNISNKASITLSKKYWSEVIH